MQAFPAFTERDMALSPYSGSGGLFALLMDTFLQYP